VIVPIPHDFHQFHKFFPVDQLGIVVELIFHAHAEVYNLHSLEGHQFGCAADLHCARIAFIALPRLGHLHLALHHSDFTRYCNAFRVLDCRKDRDYFAILSSTLF